MRTLFAQVAIGCVVLVASVSIVAAELEDAIPMDLARILFDPAGTGSFAVFTDIQSDFPAFELPAGFSVIAYLQQASSRLLALETQYSEEEAATTLNLAWGIQETFDHFSTQLSMQGWLPDSSSVGAVSATEIWTRVSPDGMNLVGTLTASDAGEDRIEMRYLIKGAR